MKREFLANFNWLTIERVLRSIGAIVVGVWVARYLGPTDYGLLNFSISFVTLFSVVGKLSIDAVVVRELTTNNEEERETLGTVFVLKLAVSFLLMLFVLPSAWLAQSQNRAFQLLALIVSFAMLAAPFDAVDIFYQAKVLSKYVVFARIVSFFLFAVARVVLIYSKASVLFFAGAYSLEFVLSAVIMAGVYSGREQPLWKWRWSKKKAIALLKDGWPLAAGAVFSIIYARIDQVMIGIMLNSSQVGVYSASVKLAEIWQFIPLLATQTLMPYFVRLRATNAAAYRRRLIQLYSGMFWAGIAVSIGVVVFGRTLITISFGAEYEMAYAPLVISIWTGVFVAQSVARSIWMVSENFQFFRFLSNMIVVPLNVGLNVLLIPMIGITGAALASLISVGAGTWLFPLAFPALRSSSIDLMLSINPRVLFAHTHRKAARDSFR